MSRVVVMAGGTGGHVFPALAVARALRARGVEITWLGTRRGLEARVVPAAGLGIEMAWLDIRGVRRSGLAGWLALPFSLARAMWQAARVFRKQHPHAALSFGGFVSGPGGLVAWLTRTPLVIHEQNAIAGMTNKWLGYVAERVLCGFPGAFGASVAAHHVGNPVRDEIRALPEPEARFATRRGRLRLLVVGGSQGARAFNDVVPQALRAMPEGARPEVRHQCGRDQREATDRAYAGIAGVQVSEFVEDMAEAYGWADLVLCRAGAMTVAELAAAGVGAILVPYPHAVDDHQSANARYLETHGAAMLLPQTELTPARLAEVLTELAASRDTLIRMARAARGADMPDATEACVQECVEAVSEAAHA
jgi:UDP-N-acetylglucosamine--N-acetylmuramyl-(pentapeptide) pyrophosphoryl-undecaprenol N-acetylglucosamine transferase